MVKYKGGEIPMIGDVFADFDRDGDKHVCVRLDGVGDPVDEDQTPRHAHSCVLISRGVKSVAGPQATAVERKPEYFVCHEFMEKGPVSYPTMEAAIEAARSLVGNAQVFQATLVADFRRVETFY